MGSELRVRVGAHNTWPSAPVRRATFSSCAGVVPLSVLVCVVYVTAPPVSIAEVPTEGWTESSNVNCQINAGATGPALSNARNTRIAAIPKFAFGLPPMSRVKDFWLMAKVLPSLDCHMGVPRTKPRPRTHTHAGI